MYILYVYFSKNKKKRMYKVSNDVYASFDEDCAFLVRKNVKEAPFHQGLGKICKILYMSAEKWIFVGGDFGLIIYSLQNRMVNYENLLHAVSKRIIHDLPIVDFDFDKKEKMTISLTGNPNGIHFHMVDPTKNNKYGITNYTIEMPHNHRLLGAYKILHVPDSMIITAGKDNKIKSWKTLPFLPTNNTQFSDVIVKPDLYVMDMICLDNNNICVAFHNCKIEIWNHKLKKIRRHYYFFEGEPYDYTGSRNSYDRFNNEILSPMISFEPTDDGEDYERDDDGKIKIEFYDEKSYERIDAKKFRFIKYREIVDPNMREKCLDLRFTENKIDKIFQPPGSKFVFVTGMIGHFQTFRQNSGKFYYVVKVFDPKEPVPVLQTVCIFVDSKITSICYDPLKDTLVGRMDIYRKTNSLEVRRQLNCQFLHNEIDVIHDYQFQEKNVEFLQLNLLQNVSVDHDLRQSKDFFRDDDHKTKFLDDNENIQKMSTILYHLTPKQIQKGEFNGYSITEEMKNQLEDLISQNP